MQFAGTVCNGRQTNRLRLVGMIIVIYERFKSLQNAFMYIIPRHKLAIIKKYSNVLIDGAFQFISDFGKTIQHNLPFRI